MFVLFFFVQYCANYIHLLLFILRSYMSVVLFNYRMRRSGRKRKPTVVFDPQDQKVVKRTSGKRKTPSSLLLPINYFS